MAWITDRISEEPVMFQGLIQAAIALVTSFGLQLDGSKVGAVTAFTAALLSFLTRQAVTPLARPMDNAGRALVPAAK